MQNREHDPYTFDAKKLSELYIAGNSGIILTSTPKESGKFQIEQLIKDISRNLFKINGQDLSPDIIHFCQMLKECRPQTFLSFESDNNPFINGFIIEFRNSCRNKLLQLENLNTIINQKKLLEKHELTYDEMNQINDREILQQELQVAIYAATASVFQSYFEYCGWSTDQIRLFLQHYSQEPSYLLNTAFKVATHYEMNAMVDSVVNIYQQNGYIVYETQRNIFSATFKQNNQSMIWGPISTDTTSSYLLTEQGFRLHNVRTDNIDIVNILNGHWNKYIADLTMVAKLNSLCSATKEYYDNKIRNYLKKHHTHFTQPFSVDIFVENFIRNNKKKITKLSPDDEFTGAVLKYHIMDELHKTLNTSQNIEIKIKEFKAVYEKPNNQAIMKQYFDSRLAYFGKVLLTVGLTVSLVGIPLAFRLWKPKSEITLEKTKKILEPTETVKLHGI